MQNNKEIKKEMLTSKNRSTLVMLPSLTEWDMIQETAKIAADGGWMIDEMTVIKLIEVANAARDRLFEDAVSKVEKSIKSLPKI